MRSPRPPLTTTFLAAFLLAASASACQVPVFRYALERWIPDDYVLASSLPEAAQLAADSHTNISLAAPSSPGATLTLRYPDAAKIPAPFWSAPDSPEALASIAGSTLRGEIIRHILRGDSAVWLLVESGDPAKDDAAFATLTSTLRQAESSLELPDGIVGVEEAKSRDLSPGEEENALASSIPLHIRFSALRVSRQNPSEAVLLALLLHMEDDLPDYSSEPLAFAFFGRGRVLPPLLAAGITTENILGDCTYLCGACSCQVKRENPGIDALFAADWDSALGATTVTTDKVLPPLSGPGDLAAASPVAGVPTPVAPPEILADSTPSPGVSLTLPAAVAAALILIGLASLRALRKH